MTFIDSVKIAVKKRASWEKHRALPVKKLIPKENYRKMLKHLDLFPKRNARCKLDHIEGLGVVMCLSTHKPKKADWELKKKAEDLGVRNVLHTEVREVEQSLYACLEEL